ncbi:MAG: hypothetical protein Q3997_00615 [Propionibacteriaceae bacterium]|nr:hypothetical protein [Propionibacteriaceae bacterium]
MTAEALPRTAPAPSWRSSLGLSLALVGASRLVFWLAAGVLQRAGGVLPASGFESGWPWLFGVYARFDHGHFQRIALGGYFQLDQGNIAYDEAFFPGYPFLARGIAALFGGGEPTTTTAMSLLTWAGLWLGAALLIHLARRGELFGADWRLVAFVVFFGPWSVFFMAPYSEGLFLACAVGAWTLARRERWGWAVALACGATALRINGLFLLPMLALMMLSGRWREPRAWARVSLLVLPSLPPALYFTYLWSVTGNWFTWFETQKHWGRTATAPWDSLVVSIRLIGEAPQFAFQRTMEVLAALVYLLVVIQLARWRRWELVLFTALTLFSLTTSQFFQSIPRSMLSCFPALVVIAWWLTRFPWWLRWLCIGLGSMILALNVTTILAGRWTG